MSKSEEKISTAKRAEAGYNAGSGEWSQRSRFIRPPKITLVAQNTPKVVDFAFEFPVTLDQYYYPRSSKIDNRDEDKTIRRYYDEHYLETTGIARVLTMMDRDAVRFERFEKNLKRLNQVQEEKNSEEAISEVLKELSDIEKDTEDLHQIKDIRDELNILTALFHVQGEVMEEMHRVIMEEETQHKPPETSENYDSRTTPSPSPSPPPSPSFCKK
ncbi:hypothetical protein F4679DRAFT_588207 [Xylaria curta]|nr:hypothetical protein F4679DRAFT_588207 [Xylaria curta]